MRSVLSVSILLAFLSACTAPGEEYWWEEGYPYGSGGGSNATAVAGSPPSAVRGAPAPGAPVREAGGALRKALDDVLVPALSIHDEESLMRATDAVRLSSGLPMVVAPAAEEAALDAGAVFELELTHPLSVRHVLDLLVEQAGEDVAWIIRHDIVLITTRQKARGRTVLRAHDIRLLVALQTDFVAPRLDRIRLIDDLEDEDGGTPFGGVATTEARLSEDDVVTLVTENVAAGTWQDEGVSISAENGVLFVTHTPAVQRETGWFLGRLAGF